MILKSFATTILYLLVSSFFTNTFAQETDQNWELLNNSPFRLQRHDDIFFLDASTGWIANGFGRIYQTTDSGENWEELAFLGGLFFRSIGFANDSLGWVGSLTTEEVLLETRDGGRTWENITSRISGPAPTGICGLSVINEQVIYGVGRFNGPPIFIRSRDGGETWESKNLTAFGFGTLIDVHFMDENHGFITGGTKGDLTGRAVIGETFDGGDNWSIRHTSNLDPDVGGEWGWKISFPTETTGYVSVEYPFVNSTGNEAKVLKTVDGGQSWTELAVSDSRDPAGLQGIGFVSENVGWPSGRGTASITTDGGETWRQIDDLDGIVNRIRLVNDTLAFAVGRRAYRWKGTSIATAITEEIEQPKLFTVDQNYPNPFNPVTTISFALEQVGQVNLTVYTLLGQEVTRLIDGNFTPGTHQVQWNGRDHAGQSVASGVYLYKLQVGAEVQTRRMILLK